MNWGGHGLAPKIISTMSPSHQRSLTALRLPSRLLSLSVTQAPNPFLTLRLDDRFLKPLLFILLFSITVPSLSFSVEKI